MNTCVISTFNCTLDEFKERVETDRSVWGQYVGNWTIAKVNDHKL